MFKKKKSKRGQQLKHAEIKPFDIPDSSPAIGLPDTSAFRTSLIMPYLTSRFELLREADGTLVSLDKFESALRNQRATGFINEREEQALLHQFHLQALKEGVQLPRSMYTAAQGLEEPEEELQDAPAGDEQAQPMSLHDFHRMRAVSGGSTMFGHNGMEVERSRTVSGRSPVLPGSPGSSTEVTPRLRRDSFEASTSFSGSEDLSQAENLSFNHDLREAAVTPPPPAARPRPPKPGQEHHLAEPWRLSRDDFQRLSRVLDEMVDDFGAGREKTVEHRAAAPSSSTNSQFFTPSQQSPRSQLSTLHARSASRSLLAEDEEEEEVDPLLSRSGRDSGTTSRSHSQMSHHLSVASTTVDGRPDSQGTLTARTPTPPRIESPALADGPPARLGTPTVPSPDHALLSEASASQFLTPTTRLAETDAPGPSPYTTFQAMFPSPTVDGPAPHPVPLDSPINRFPTDQTFDNSPADLSISSSNGVWSTSDLELYNHSPMPAQVETLPQDVSGSQEASNDSQTWATNGRITSEETVLSTAPTEFFSSPRVQSKPSLSSIGSSYREEEIEGDVDSLCEDVVFGAEEPALLDNRSSVDSNGSFTLPPFDRTSKPLKSSLHQRQLSQPSTSRTTLESEEYSSPYYEQPSQSEQERCLQGLCISDLTEFQSKLVLSASQRSGGRLSSDPSPAIAQRALFNFVGPTLDVQQPDEDEDPTPQIQQLPVNPPDSAGCSSESEPLHTPSLLGSVESPTTDLSAPSTPPANVLLEHEVKRPSSSLSRQVSYKSNSGAAPSEPLLAKPDLQSSFKFPAVQDQVSPAAKSNDHLPILQQLQRAHAPSPDAERMREVEQQMRAANDAFKKLPAQQQSSGGLGGMMRRRKSSKNLKAVSISTPTLVASSKKEYEPVPPVPPMPASAGLLSNSQGTVRSKHSKERSGDQTNGLQRFLSRLRKKSDSPQHFSTASDFGNSPASSSHGLQSPAQLPPIPASAPFGRTEFEANQTFASPVRVQESPKADPERTPTPPPSGPTYGRREPISYDVTKSRKRAGSVSQQSTDTSSPALSQETWTPVDPETSMASWRSSTVTQSTRPDSSAESVRKLREAADALGLDPSKVDQLVADATPTIPEDSELVASQRPKSKVLRRTIIVGNNSRLSQMLQAAPEIFSTKPSTPPPSRPVAPALRRTQTYTQTSTLSTRQPEMRHRKISSESASHPARPLLPGVGSASHGKQTSLDLTHFRPISKQPFKPLALASSMPASASNSSLLSAASAGSHSARRSVKPMRRLTQEEDDEVLASGELPTTGRPTSRRMSTRGDMQAGDRLEINEMEDGSFFWQVVRSKLRNDRPASEVSSFSGFHSRTSSADSMALPEPSSPPPRVARPSILDPKRDAKSRNDMRLVWAPHQGHRRMRSTEGVGKLPYIRRHQEEETRAGFRNSHYSVNSDVEVFEADDEMVSHLIEDLTSSMDHGAFNFIRAEALQNHSSPGSTPGLRLRSPPTSP